MSALGHAAKLARLPLDANRVSFGSTAPQKIRVPAFFSKAVGQTHDLDSDRNVRVRQYAAIRPVSGNISPERPLSTPKAVSGLGLRPTPLNVGYGSLRDLRVYGTM